MNLLEFAKNLETGYVPEITTPVPEEGISEFEKRNHDVIESLYIDIVANILEMAKEDRNYLKDKENLKDQILEVLSAGFAKIFLEQKISQELRGKILESQLQKILTQIESVPVENAAVDQIIQQEPEVPLSLQGKDEDWDPVEIPVPPPFDVEAFKIVKQAKSVTDLKTVIYDLEDSEHFTSAERSAEISAISNYWDSHTGLDNVTEKFGIREKLLELELLKKIEQERLAEKDAENRRRNEFSQKLRAFNNQKRVSELVDDAKSGMVNAGDDFYDSLKPANDTEPITAEEKTKLLDPEEEIAEPSVEDVNSQNKKFAAFQKRELEKRLKAQRATDDIDNSDRFVEGPGLVAPDKIEDPEPAIVTQPPKVKVKLKPTDKFDSKVDDLVDELVEIDREGEVEGEETSVVIPTISQKAKSLISLSPKDLLAEERETKRKKAGKIVYSSRLDPKLKRSSQPGITESENPDDFIVNYADGEGNVDPYLERSVDFDTEEIISSLEDAIKIEKEKALKKSRMRARRIVKGK